MTSNQKKFGIAIIAAILCALAFYFLYWIKTPTYSLGIIRDSIQKHDVATFEKHVDLDALLNKGYDDAFVAYDKIEGNNMMSNPFATGFIQMLKPTVVAGLKEKALEAVKGEAETPQAKAPADDTERMTQDFKKKSGINDSTVSGASVVSQENNIAIVALKIHNKRLDKDFELKVKMAKLDDGTWKAKELANLVDFMVSIDKATKEKIAELNKSIREEIKNKVTVSNTEMQFGYDRGFFFTTPRFDCKATLKNTSDQQITAVNVKYVIKDEKDTVCKESEQPYPNKSLAVNDEMTLQQKVGLDTFSERDNKILRNPGNYSIEAEVTSITFADGTSIHLLTQLPEESAQ